MDEGANDRSAGVRRPSRFGANGFGAIVASVLFIGGQVLVVIQRNKEIAQHNGTPVANPTLDYVSATLWGLAILLVLLLALRLPAMLRDHRLAKTYPQAIVLSAGRTPPLQRAIAEIVAEGTNRIPSKELPMTFSVMVDSHRFGLRISRTGTKDYPEAFGENWSSVGSVRFGEVQEAGRRSNALFIEVPCGTSTVTLPLVIVGRGLLGAFPQKRETLEALAVKCTSYCADARTTGLAGA